MAVPVFHPCQFQFSGVDISRMASVTSGGTSLSGLDDPIETDGGGFWRATFTDGEAIERADGLAWRALTEGMDGGSQAVIVKFCAERYFQPVGDGVTVPHSDDTAFNDHTEYSSSGATFTTTTAAPLRATSMTIVGGSELPLIGGELFSIDHPRWGWRAYRIIRIGDAGQIEFRPPLREAVAAGSSVEFDTPRCKMRLSGQASNQTEIGRYTACAISFVEDMRKPPDA